jgi:hypothetical protein
MNEGLLMPSPSSLSTVVTPWPASWKTTGPESTTIWALPAMSRLFTM